MYLKREGSHFMPNIAIGLVQVMLFKFLADHFALYFKAFFSKGKTEHPVAFEPERCFNIFCRQLAIIIGKIIGSIGIVLPPRRLEWFIIRGNINRTTKHQMLKQMGKSCFFRVFIPGAYIVHHVYNGHGCGMIFMHYNF